ncbi:MAG TPA: VWA domain-containing protein [Candidatus Bipolaricaulota bacterium]
MARELAMERVWRRLRQRYRFIRIPPFPAWAQQLERTPERAYEALQALDRWERPLGFDQVRAYFQQLLALQQRDELDFIDPDWLLEALDALTVEAAGRFFHFCLRREPGALPSALSRRDGAAQAAFEGLRKGLSAHLIERVLRYYGQALCESAYPLKFIPWDNARFSDARTLTLADHVAAYPAHPASRAEEDLHFLLYKWLITHEVGHRQAGTYRFGLADEQAGRGALSAFLRSFADPFLAEALFHLAEDVRVESQLLRQYPGFKADRDRLLAGEWPFRDEPADAGPRFLEALLQRVHWGKSHLTLPQPWRALSGRLLEEVRALAKPGSDVAQTARWTQGAYAQIEPLLGGRLQRGRLQRHALAALFPYEPPLHLETDDSPAPLALRPQAQEPAAGDEAPPDALEETHGPGEKAFPYDEWDFRAGAYRPGWCALRQRQPQQGGVDETLSSTRLTQVRRAFEWMAEEDWVRHKRQLEGDEIDIDAWVESAVDRRAGGPLPEKFYTQRLRRRRDLCAAILLDQSDSTARLTPGGKPVIQVERNALRTLCEALETLRDEYALFSYSGEGRHQVDFYALKPFDQAFGPAVQGRLNALAPLAQNRDGCALRHATRQVQTRAARTRLLLHVTDGRPWDHGYTQRYALEDAKKAVQEARALRVKVFGVICDPHAPESAKNTYGPGRAVILKDVSGLTELLLALYKRITW